MDAVLDNTQATVTAPVIGSSTTDTSTTSNVASTSVAQDKLVQPNESNSVCLATKDLQEVVARAAKGSTMENLIPLTSLMCVRVEDKKLYAATTDNVNFLTAVIEIDSTGKNVKFVVDTKLFSTLISKLSKTTTTLTVNDNSVVITSDGKYTINIANDQSTGAAIDFPVRSVNADGTTLQLTQEEINSILSYNKVCKKDSKDMPELYNYYFDDKCACTTDTFKACWNPIKLSDRPIMLSSRLVDLIPSIMDESGVSICQNSDFVKIFSTNGEIIGKKQTSLELQKFPILDMQEVFEIRPSYKVALNTSLFYKALERISLFVDPKEKNKVSVRFTPEGVDLIAEAAESVESMPYVKEKDEILPTESITFELDMAYLRCVTGAVASEKLVISIEKEQPLYFEGDPIRMIVCEIGEEDEEDEEK